ncbi:MAG: hypothetical protein H6983_09270 [Ectothiorhodospiraceae bacterium]|nr:hypothetical protein [Ectothiorhodospiraceae bacterium]
MSRARRHREFHLRHPARLVLALVVTVGTLLGLSPATAQPPLRYTMEQAVVAGRPATAADFADILVVCGSQARSGAPGLELAPGCLMETGRDTVVATIDGDGAEIIAEPRSQVDFLPDAIRVVAGRVFVKIREALGWRQFEVDTIFARAAPDMTMFEVEIRDDAAVFRQFEGRVRVTGEGSTRGTVVITPGQAADARRGADVTRRPMSRAEIAEVVERIRAVERALGTQIDRGSNVDLLIPDLTEPQVRIDAFGAAGDVLIWQTTGAERVEILGLGAVPPSGDLQVRPRETTRYELVAHGADGSTARASATVVVEPAPTAAPPRIVYFDSRDGVLRWRTENARTVEIQGIGRVAAEGDMRVSPQQTTRYVLIARGADGRSDSATTTVEVRPAEPAAAPRIVYFEARDDGRGALLVWSAVDADSVELLGVGTMPTTGQWRVSPRQPTRYTLVARGVDGRSVQASVTVRPPAPDVAPPQILAFQATGNLLTWRTSGATVVRISGLGTVAASGRVQVDPRKSGYSYTLTATNAVGQSVERTVRLTLEQEPSTGGIIQRIPILPNLRQLEQTEPQQQVR